MLSKPREGNAQALRAQLNIYSAGSAKCCSNSLERNYMIYRVFTVFLCPQTVHNLFNLCYPAYFVITPQAMRSPAFPAGSLFISSALA